MKQKLLVVFGVLGLAGCTAHMAALSRSYVAPVDGPTAKVRFSTNGELTLVPGSSCLNWKAPGSGVVVSNKNYLGAKPVHIDKKIGMEGNAPAGFTSAEVLVAANKSLSFDFYNELLNNTGTVLYKCTGSGSFLPKANEEYQIIVNHETSGGGACSIVATNLKRPSENVPVYPAGSC